MLCLCAAALLLAGSAHAQAYASASADANNGASVSSNSVAVSNDGRPTSSVVTASGSGPGVVIRCRQAAVNGQQLSKECTDAGVRACQKGWWDAPACSGGAKETARDAAGCAWGFESGRSCALRCV
jgi:hypothetical protein